MRSLINKGVGLGEGMERKTLGVKCLGMTTKDVTLYILNELEEKNILRKVKKKYSEDPNKTPGD